MAAFFVQKGKQVMFINVNVNNFETSHETKIMIIKG